VESLPLGGTFRRVSRWSFGISSVFALALGSCDPRPGEGGSVLDAAGAPNESGCEFDVRTRWTAIPTVVAVEWSLGGEPPEGAQIHYRLKEPPPNTVNIGGVIPVDVRRPDFRTLLLGLKQEQVYLMQVEALRDGRLCRSDEVELERTGRLMDAPRLTREVAQADRVEPGFIVSSSGTSEQNQAFILDTDGDVVWSFAAPVNTTRALLDYEAERMWMLSLNLNNEIGEMRSVLLDGGDERRNVPGLERAHHDFTVMPGGKIAAISWLGPEVDAESELLVWSPDGKVERPFRIGENLYRSDSYHANAIHFIEEDGGFTISDRNPSVFVRVGPGGEVKWQVGGNCDGAPAGQSCYARAWEITHGHHLLPDGTFLAFNNTRTDRARVFEFRLSEGSPFSAELSREHPGVAPSTNLGDVERLPSGNTLITYSSSRLLTFVDQNWELIQSLSIGVGYASFRRSLYGPPGRP
jgi:hypothetical protein